MAQGRDGDHSIFMEELSALMVSGWNGLHIMYPRSSKEEILWEHGGAVGFGSGAHSKRQNHYS